LAGDPYNPDVFHNIRPTIILPRNAPKAGAASKPAVSTMKLTPNQGSLGVRIDDIDLSKPVTEAQFATILSALGRHGVICFPKQTLDARALKAFSERFGSLQGSPTGTYCEPDVPEVMLLSNILENGKPIGLADAGQDWHTDMSYNAVIGFTNVLYGIKIPHRDGKPLGNTVFADMRAAHDDLSPAIKSKLASATATHDFNKFWEEMRRRPGLPLDDDSIGGERQTHAESNGQEPAAQAARAPGACGQCARAKRRRRSGQPTETASHCAWRPQERSAGSGRNAHRAGASRRASAEDKAPGHRGRRRCR